MRCEACQRRMEDCACSQRPIAGEASGANDAVSDSIELFEEGEPALPRPIAADSVRYATDFSGMDMPTYVIRKICPQAVNIFMSDNCEAARRFCHVNYGPPVLGAYTAVEARPKVVPGLDLYIAGPPCQSFSRAGKRKGTDDARGGLFEKAIEFIVNSKPRIAVLEN
eukprot:13594433-Alexandrium_andersonii.AAC.1